MVLPRSQMLLLQSLMFLPPRQKTSLKRLLQPSQVFRRNILTSPFSLKLNPDQFIEFKSDKLLTGPVCADVSLTNPTKVRQVYKIKCTSNEIFRVRPPVSFLKPDETMVIKFTLSTKTVPDINKHFFAFYHMAAPETTEKTVAKLMWTATSKPEGIKRVPIKVLKDNGSPWTLDSTPSADAAIVPAASVPAPPVDKK